MSDHKIPVNWLCSENEFLVLDEIAVKSLQAEYRIICQPILPFSTSIPALLLPEQVEVLYENGYSYFNYFHLKRKFKEDIESCETTESDGLMATTEVEVIPTASKWDTQKSTKFCRLESFDSQEKLFHESPTPHFPNSISYMARLITFRDLWRKGFYLTSGEKFGCNYLAYEKPPGDGHSRYMVIILDSISSSLTPLDLISVTRVASQVKKDVLLSIIRMEELEERPFLRYLMTVNGDVLRNLYESPPCTAAIYRMLPPIAQKCVLYLLYQNPNKLNKWKLWVDEEHHLTIFQHLVLLRRLRIIEYEEDKINRSEVLLNLDFRMHCLSSLLTDSLVLSQVKIHPDEEKARKQNLQEICKKSMARWECILCHLAMPSDSSAKDISNATRTLFQYAGLCKEVVVGKDPEISSSGFQFLLLGRSQQIWHYIINYLRYAETQNEDLFSLIELLLKLSLCVTADNYLRPLAIEPDWSKNSIETFFCTLRELGLIFIRKRKDGWFFVTSLMKSLFIDENNYPCMDLNEEMGDSIGFLIVETNFRIYAYTSSTLQLAILSTFSELVYRFTTFSIGVITRESVRRAFQTGITAKQIVHYLTSNAHPKTFLNGRVPATVVDQIHLWERERKRFSFADATLYTTFKSDDEYAALRDFSADKKISLWSSNDRKIIVVDGKNSSTVRESWNLIKVGRY